ncbi:hypothetical protein [Bacillus weihaiensis]|uniref:hypothetical protein n=1 Tax=Bacillus weihaiensis TaxID=1547283 RepID=UPI0023538BEE|nr:hypothetical protein [Bacillus weihaiensis]
MNKITLSILLAVLLLGLIACSNQTDQVGNNDEKVVNSNEQDKKINVDKDVREVVWGQLSSEQKERIDGTWEFGKVSKIILNEDMMSLINDKTYDGEEVYLIDFPTKNKFIPNNMIVYADLKTFDYIGSGLVE